MLLINLVLNTIKIVKVLDKSERQLAYDVGLGELYDRMNNKQDNEQQDSEQELWRRRKREW